MAGDAFIRSRLLAAAIVGCILFAPAALGDDGAKPRGVTPAAAYVPPLEPLVRQPASELRDVVERYAADRQALLRRYNVDYSPERRARLREFITAWQARLEELPYEPLGLEGRIDYLLLGNRLRSELELLAREEKIEGETAPLLPFAPAIIGLQEARRRMETLDPAAAANALARLAEDVEKARQAVEAGLKPDAGEGALKTTKVVAYRAAEILEAHRRTLEQWFRYYNGYAPLFSWWTAAPYKKADERIRAYQKFLRERVVGIKEGEEEPIVGYPIGREALLADLRAEMVPYAPEELVAIAEREFAWCEAEMRKAARAMGLGDDWKAALERVKTLHVEPGRQPDLIRDLALEAIEYVEKNNLVTVPPLARDIWRIEMLSPERQRENPFFLGGEVIQVSFPTDAMAHEDKLMSLRGNNVHFARATVHHELIPGHHLQGFLTERYHPHRRLFATSFWGEGWALWWEMLLWDRGFPQSPENRIGMLFWRMHRAARIIFSLGFHLGTMTPEQCVNFLVERVGHERANAAGEVRRSFRGNYVPLYQAAYMIGGLQFRALHEELVASGRMTPREFHDAILTGGRIPVEMVRARLTAQPPPREFAPRWRFAGDPLAKPKP